MNVEYLISQIKAYNPDADFELLRKSYEYSENLHAGQQRKSGEPFFIHCVETAQTLTDLKLDIHTICAGLLHDVLEDTSATREGLASLFGETIVQLVEGVTKIGKYHFQGRIQQRQAENYLKLLLATAEDIRVILIKLADRLHNMETLSFQPAHKEQEIAKETLEIYAPMAHRLGISWLKNRLEDLAFKHLHPVEYKDIANLLSEKLEERRAYTNKMVKIIEQELKQAGIKASVHGRPKHIYSIYQKIHLKGTPFEEIRDLIGLRILVNTINECYLALGVLHSKWNHHPERFKDMIGPAAKKNGYQSLHTTILDSRRSIEIQIRTFDMHKVAEDGIAAHWSYKEGISSTKESQSIFAGLKQMLEDIQQFKDLPHQLIQSMKRELFPDEVYVFTPKGDLLMLPAGSTPIDFAYAIHTDIGDTCCRAEVDGRMVPLRYRLQNGDRVNIIPNPKSHPSHDWLRWVRTARARYKIRHWCKEQDRAQAVELGKKFLKAEMRRQSLNLRTYMKSPELLTIAKELKLLTIEDLLVQIGNGNQSAQHIIKLLKPEDSTPEKEEQPTTNQPPPVIQLEAGIDLAPVRVMKCCNPIPGDEIIGYITRGRGVSIHKVRCSRILNEPQRVIHIEWKPVDGVTYPTRISLECSDRPGMLGAITTSIGQSGVNIQKGNFGPASYQTGGNGIAYEKFTLEVTSVEQLEEVMTALRRLKGVRRVTREREA